MISLKHQIEIPYFGPFMKRTTGLLLISFLLFIWTTISAQAQKNQSVPMPPPAKAKEVSRTVPSPGHEKKKAILAIIQKQEEDWNRKSLDAFLEAYWNSDTLRYVTNRGVTYGFEKVAEIFRRNFPDTASMGKIDFDVIHVELITENDAMVTGKFLQKVDKKFRGGYFTFLFRRLKGKWKIVADHTS
jgi:ketosteroid isomerase-like protein